MITTDTDQQHRTRGFFPLPAAAGCTLAVPRTPDHGSPTHPFVTCTHHAQLIAGGLPPPVHTTLHMDAVRYLRLAVG